MRFATKLIGWVQFAGVAALVLILAACGGGGGDSGNSSSSGDGISSLPAGPTQQPIPVGAANTVAITVDKGLGNLINIPTVSVTVCVPGTSTCQTIDHVQLDTGSYGLRVLNTALNATLASGLTPLTVNGSQQLAECTQFADGFTWGTVRSADVIVGQKLASAIPIQVVGDLTTVPAGCTGVAENTVAQLHVNGILGVGVAPYDCGAGCQNAASSNYFGCVNGNCTAVGVSTAQQVANPVPRFTGDNNGLIVQLPPVPNTGAPSATGTLVFGIGTQSNNPLAAAQTFTSNAAGDLVNSTFNNVTVSAFFDTGSNGYFFNDTSLPVCGSNEPGFYCPATAQTRPATVRGSNSSTATITMSIVSAATLVSNGSNYAFNTLAGPGVNGTSVDFGLPFFFGRYVYYGIDQRASSGPAPFIAF
ncbi:DUF3443 domain-containing protein [Paraburkholderia sp. BL10I2N1]|uniref:DUF3443 domain-containing protein n=1 Tax=Paraburkholderia sp. BL10I2N1 TaxID=1938796 RepID=UPI00105B9DA7|nr:DUF3443 domain-containing protein [Paraburkholderia sp. BL10I2N1]TDN67972.1 uncharacterized protein DUF3443 [Paraburkholderia sp. BL10I2N1]